MTVLIQNTSVTNTFDFWRNRTNELAFALSNSAVTVDSNTAVGNAAITGTFTSNALVTNTFSVNSSISVGNTTVNGTVNSTSITFGTSTFTNNTVNSVSGFFANTIKVGNSSVNVSVNSSIISISNSSININLSIPTAAQVSNSQYYFNANGSWSLVLQPYYPISNNSVTTTGTSAQMFDSYPIATYNSVEYTIATINGSANGYSTTKLLTFHDRVTAYVTEYATMNSNGSLGVFSANCDGTSVRLWVTPVFNSLTVKYAKVSV